MKYLINENNSLDAYSPTCLFFFYFPPPVILNEFEELLGCIELLTRIIPKPRTLLILAINYSYIRRDLL